MLAQITALVAFALAFVRRVLEHLSGVGLFRTAASLAFTTLLGLVPLFTVAFAYLARLPIFDRTQDALESFLLRFFLPGSGSVIHRYLTEFTAKTADLKGVGILFVIITAFLLVWQGESEINAFWDVQAPRPFARRTFLILLALTNGPAALRASAHFLPLLVHPRIRALLHHAF